MTRGIIATLQLLVTLAFAAPLALLGVQFLVSERFLMGSVFLGIAAAMVLLQEFLTTPQDIPTKVIERVTGRVVDDGDDEKPTK